MALEHCNGQPGRFASFRKLTTKGSMADLESKTAQFALVTNDGDTCYPYKKRELASGRYGYAISPPGKRDRDGGADYVEDIETVIRKVVFEGYGVRSKSNQRPGNTLRLKGTAVRGYKIATSLRHLVHGAEVEPLGELAA